MINLNNSSLLDILPPNLRDNDDVIASCKAIDEEFQQLSNFISKSLVFADIDHADENVLDHLAIELNTDFYDNTLPINKKRNLVKNALIYKFTKGTPYAIELITSDAFDISNVIEWFDYGGNPFHFKVSTTDAITDPSKFSNLIEAINAVKNVKSYLESIVVERISPFNLYTGILVCSGDTETINTNIPT